MKYAKGTMKVLKKVNLKPLLKSVGNEVIGTAVVAYGTHLILDKKRGKNVKKKSFS